MLALPTHGQIIQAQYLMHAQGINQQLEIACANLKIDGHRT
jgi:hypothetical protein